MRSKWRLAASVAQLLAGLAAIVSFVVLAGNGENMTKWIITLLLAIAFVILGIIGILEYIKAGDS